MKARALLALAITGAAAWAAAGLRLRSGVEDSLPSGDPAVRAWLDLSRRFDAFDTLLVGLEEREGPMTREGLQGVQAVTRALDGLKAAGVLGASSLANVATLRQGADGAVDSERLMAAIPADDRALAAFRERVRADAQVAGALVSRDLRGYAVVVRIDPRRDATAVAARVREAVEKARGPLAAYYFGAPFFAAVPRTALRARLDWILPAQLLLLLAVLLLGVRRPRVIARVLGGTALSLVWWLGALRLFHLGLSTASLAAAPVLAALALAAFAAQVESSRPLAPLLSVALGFLAVALAASALTAFALATAAGLAAIALVSVTVGNGLVVRSEHGTRSGNEHGAPPFAPSVASASERSRGAPLDFEPAALRSRRIGLVVAIALGLGTLALASGTRFLVTPRDMFSPRDAVGQALSFFDRRFGGSDIVQVSFRGDLKDPAVAARLLRLTDLLEGSGAFADVRSVAQILAFLNHGFGGNWGIPPTREGLANVWFFLEGNPDVRSLVSDKRDEAMLTLRLPPGADPEKLVANVQAAIAASGDLAAARPRLQALARLAGLPPDATALEDLIRRASQPPTPQDRAAVAADVLPRLRQWLASPDSPYSPSEPEWVRLSSALPGGRAAVQNAAASTRLPDAQRGPFVDTVLAREGDLSLQARSALLARSLPGADQLPASALVRLQGAVADLLAPPPGPGTATVTVSGFPVVAPAIARDLARSLWLGLLALLGASALALFVFTRQAWTLLAAAAAAALPLLVTRALHLGIDPGSAPLYLLPPALVFVLGPSRGLRSPSSSFLFALAAAAVPLLFTGAPPVTRVAAALALGLLASTAMSAMSLARNRSPRA